MKATGVDPTAATGFDRAAADYERGRPGYPHAVAKMLEVQLGLGAGSLVCDLAAGTGKFTRLLLSMGCDVVAVEPVGGIRDQLHEILPDIEVIDGTAEAMPIGSGTIDAVTVAQAFHWFDRGAALSEVHRVLRPGGGLGLVWNRRDETVPWVKEMSTVLSWHDRPHSSYETTDWTAVVADHGGFTPLLRRNHAWEQPMTRDRLEARVRSISFVAASPTKDRETFVRDVLALVETFDEPFALPYVTHVYWCRREA